MENKKACNKLTFEEVNKRFVEQGRTDIELCEDGFCGWTKKSKFYDKIVEAYFWAEPVSVYDKRRSHPRRNNLERVTLEIAKERFSDRTDIVLCDDGFNGWCHKSKFYDLIQEDYFFSVPKKVYRQKSSHPKRAVEKRKKTNLDRFGYEHVTQCPEIMQKSVDKWMETLGVPYPMQSEKVKQKSRETCKKIYGVECSLNSPEVQEKIKNTTLEIYGVDHVMKSDVVKDKVKKTCMERYGVDNSLKANVCIEKMKNTNMERYGSEYIGGSREIIEKTRNTMMERYGVPNGMLVGVEITRIKETGESANAWLERQIEPKPSKTSFFRKFGKQNVINLADVELFLKEYRITGKSSLEILTEKIFGLTHFNRKIRKLKENNRPDFKLSENVYMNVDGLYWHSSEKLKNKEHHSHIRSLFENNDLFLFQFYESEIEHKPDVVKSIVYKKIKDVDFKHVTANTQCKRIDNHIAISFYDEHSLKNNHEHLEHFSHAGLYYEDVLCYVVTYHVLNNNIVKVIDYVEHKECIVYCIKQVCDYISSIDTQNLTLFIESNLRYDYGERFVDNGFEIVEDNHNDVYVSHENVQLCFDGPNKQERFYHINGAGIRVLSYNKHC